MKMLSFLFQLTKKELSYGDIEEKNDFYGGGEGHRYKKFFIKIKV